MNYFSRNAYNFFKTKKLCNINSYFKVNAIFKMPMKMPDEYHVEYSVWIRLESKEEYDLNDALKDAIRRIFPSYSEEVLYIDMNIDGWRLVRFRELK